MKATLALLFSLAAVVMAAPNASPQGIQLPPRCGGANECRNWCSGRIPYCEPYLDYSSGNRCVCSN
ncbi:hypothetical protein BS50DRAFT_574838 [Corynespora cassiicola Philippines]|uniref:Uncharacterized protein n=1 Tax=Corynespora cassiicola Philippines TaxID=1448308 RepID=A0A2T2NM22_CORCC|nr:hypothetical protein BS50DRAFT_574838 [Corynespora cassiicola Philippines]